jgi:hypothetical protein
MQMYMAKKVILSLTRASVFVWIYSEMTIYVTFMKIDLKNTGCIFLLYPSSVWIQEVCWPVVHRLPLSALTHVLVCFLAPGLLDA